MVYELYPFRARINHNYDKRFTIEEYTKEE